MCNCEWINPNDKTQQTFLPFIGQRVLFANDGVVYYGHHTGGSFRTGTGVCAMEFNTWECEWTPLPPAPKPGESKEIV